MEQLLETGKIVTLHALKGEVKVEPWCDSPELLAEFDELYLDSHWVNVERARVQKRMVIMMRFLMRKTAAGSTVTSWNWTKVPTLSPT